MKKITYNNKQYVLNDPQYPVEETVTDTDMNEIKEVVNFNADETLEENIKIKEQLEQTKEQLEQTKEQLEQTKDALINITTEKSSSIDVQDSSNLPAKIDVFGTSSQETREGYNLLNVASEFEVYQLSSTIDLPLKAGTYTIKFDDVETSNASVNSYVCLFTANSETVSYQHITKADKKKTFTLNTAVNQFKIWSADSNDESQGVTTTFKNLMIYEGTDDKTYEEYGESPSPEFESKIENVEGNVDITVANSNLTSTKIVEDLNNAGVTINSDSSFKIDMSKGSFTDWNQIDLLFGNNKKDEQYKLTYHINQNNNTYLPKFRFIYTDGTADGGNANTGSTDIDMEVTSQLGKTIERISLSWNTQSGGGIVTFSNIYLRKIEDTSNFVEPEKQTITFPLQAGQKLYKGDYPADDGIHHVRKQVEFDGTENWEHRNTNSSGISTFSIPTIGTEDYKRYEGFKAMCTHFKDLGTVTTASLMYSKSRGFSFYYNPNNLSEKSFYINTSEQSDLNSFKAWLAQQKQAGTPVIVEYELAEEEIEPYTEEQQEAYNKLQNVLSYKTVTNVFTNQGLLEFKYVADTQTFIVNTVKNELANTNQQVLNLVGGN